MTMQEQGREPVWPMQEQATISQIAEKAQHTVEAVRDGLVPAVWMTELRLALGTHEDPSRMAIQVAAAIRADSLRPDAEKALIEALGCLNAHGKSHATTDAQSLLEAIREDALASQEDAQATVERFLEIETELETALASARRNRRSAEEYVSEVEMILDGLDSALDVRRLDEGPEYETIDVRVDVS